MNSICSELNNKSNNICDHAINGKNEIIQYGSNDTNQNTKQENTNVNIQELSQKENENKLNSSPSLSKYYENKENFKTSQTDDKNILPSLLELAKQDHADEPIVRNLNYKYNNEEGNNISHISSLETVASLNPIQKFDWDHYKKNFPEEDKFINEEKYFVHKLNDPKYIQSQPNVNNTETYQTELWDNQTKFSQNWEKNVESFSKNSKDFGKIDYYDSWEHQRYHYSKNYRGNLIIIYEFRNQKMKIL